MPCSSVGFCRVVVWCGCPVFLWWRARCGVVLCGVVLLRAVLCGVAVCVVSRYAFLFRCCVVLYGCVGRLCVFVHTALCHVLLPCVVQQLGMPLFHRHDRPLLLPVVPFTSVCSAGRGIPLGKLTMDMEVRGCTGSYRFIPYTWRPHSLILWRHPRVSACMCGCLVFVCLVLPCRSRNVALTSSLCRFPHWSRVSLVLCRCRVLFSVVLFCWFFVMSGVCSAPWCWSGGFAPCSR